MLFVVTVSSVSIAMLGHPPLFGRALCRAGRWARGQCRPARRRPSWARGAGCSAALLAHMHSGAYHGLMLPPLLVPWTLVLAVFGRWPWRRWFASALPIGIGGGLAVALYLPYAIVRE